MIPNEQKTAKITGGCVTFYEHTFTYTLTIKATNKLDDVEFSKLMNDKLLKAQNFMIDKLGINATISNLSVI